MNFCYVDESGTGDEPYAVMVGIIASAYRMRVTKNHWDSLLEMLSSIAGKQISEIHTKDFYPGNDVWRSVNGTDRSKVVDAIFSWLADRKHNIVYAAVDKNKFNFENGKDPYVKQLHSIWKLLALHICLAIQKNYQKEKRNKGNTLLIFDEEKTESNTFAEIINNPFAWTDTYYCYNGKGTRLNQIIDVPYFANSKHVGLIQVADFISFFLRKYIELNEGTRQEAYVGEKSLINGWINAILSRSIPKSSIYLPKDRCKCADIFYRCAPTCLL